MQIHLNLIMELISLLVAVLYYPYIEKSYMKWCLPFLAFVFGGELIASYGHYSQNKPLNISVYYLISIGESIFYNYIFYKICDRASLKKMIISFACISILVFSLGLVFDREDYKYLLPSLIFFGFCLAIIALVCIYIKFDNDENKELLFSNSGFWIAMGVSLFFSGSSIVFALHDFIVKQNLFLFGIRLYNFVPQVLCIVLYSCISIAIILCKKKNKISL